MALALAAGFLLARAGWHLMGPVFAGAALQRPNYRGVQVPTGAGVLLALVALSVESVRLVADAVGQGDGWPAPAARVAVMLAVAGFALLGLLDDVAGDGSARGLRGHLGALAHGRLTTGMLKLAGGAGVALAAVAVARPSSGLRLLVDGAVVALAANLGNLFDRAPGRTLKASVLAFVALLVGASVGWTALVAVAVVVGAGVGLMAEDLGERLMLGDAGANPLGAALGLGLVLTCSAPVRNVALVALVALTGLSEVVSFSRLIESVAPLRALDRAGRRPV